MTSPRDRSSIVQEASPVLEVPLDTAAEPQGPPAIAPPGRVRMLLVLGSLSALGPAAMDGYLAGLPSMADDFGVSASLAQISVTAFLVGLGGGQLVAGPLSDVFGRRRPMLIAIGLYVLASLACGAAPSIGTMIACRLLQGALAAAGIVISRAVVRDLHSGAAAARFLSRLVMIYGLAPLLAPLLGGLLLTFTDWRGLFVAMAAFGLALVVATFFLLPETLPPERRRRGSRQALLRTYGQLLGDRRFLGNALALGLATAAVVGYVSAASFVLQDVFGVSPQIFGLLFGLNAAAMIVGSQINAHLVQRHDPRRLLELAGFALAGVGAVLVVAAALSAPLWIVALCLFAVMGSWGFIPANAISLAMEDHRDVAGAASAVLGVFQYALAGLVAPLVGLAGRDSALPMALVILGAGLSSMAAVSLLTKRRSAVAG